MCGICGIWGNPDQEATNAMVKAMHHRGPDDSGSYINDHISLGMDRLAVIDINPTGHQPMCNAEKNIWIVFNGEIYNFLLERKKLEGQGHRFVSNSDTEVILHLYEEYGDNFLSRLRGMFALAIYDFRPGNGQGRLLLARDQMGIKPLLYTEQNGRLIFASEIKALLASGLVEHELEPIALRQLLTFGSIYQPNTMLRGVKMLLPAHRMIIENGQKRIERYWSLETDRHPELRNLPYSEQVQALSAAVNESVRLQMVSDVPLGAFLSGGIDSSILVAMMAREAGQRVNTFSVGFETEGASIDESEEALKTSRYLGTNHTHVVVTGKEVREDLFNFVSGLDQPSVDGLNSYFVCKAARQGMTVAISGTGGDELFAGYPWYRNMALEVRKEPPFLKRMLTQIASWPVFDDIPSSRIQYRVNQARINSGFLARYAQQYQIFGTIGASALISSHLRRSAQAGRIESQTLKSVDEIPHNSVIDRVTGLCLRGYTANQLLRDIDAVSMSHSLEVRVPYLDVVLADMALSLPDQTKIDLNQPLSSSQTTYRSTGVKRILIDVGRSYLPKDFDLQPKRGFAMPFDAWLRDPLKNILNETLDESRIRERGWLNPIAVNEIKHQFEIGQIHWSQPWLLMMTELWATQVLD